MNTPNHERRATATANPASGAIAIAIDPHPSSRCAARGVARRRASGAANARVIVDVDVARARAMASRDARACVGHVALAMEDKVRATTAARAVATVTTPRARKGKQWTMWCGS